MRALLRSCRGSLFQKRGGDICLPRFLSPPVDRELIHVCSGVAVCEVVDLEVRHQDKVFPRRWVVLRLNARPTAASEVLNHAVDRNLIEVDRISKIRTAMEL